MRESGELVRDIDRTTDVRPGMGYTEVYIQLVAEGPGKQFDNIVVRRGGCDATVSRGHRGPASACFQARGGVLLYDRT